MKTYDMNLLLCAIVILFCRQGVVGKLLFQSFVKVPKGRRHVSLKLTLTLL